MQVGQHVHTVNINFGPMLDDELEHFRRVVAYMRNRYAGNGEGSRPGIADAFNGLLIAVSDERKRREAEHVEVDRMLRHGDRLDQVEEEEIPEDMRRDLEDEHGPLFFG